jgi:hypothetical protein
MRHQIFFVVNFVKFTTPWSQPSRKIYLKVNDLWNFRSLAQLKIVQLHHCNVTNVPCTCMFHVTKDSFNNNLVQRTMIGHKLGTKNMYASSNQALVTKYMRSYNWHSHNMQVHDTSYISNWFTKWVDSSFYEFSTTRHGCRSFLQSNMWEFVRRSKIYFSWVSKFDFIFLSHNMWILRQ